ncbi:3-hydroxyacyl-CoA dehydrogenase family protein [Microbacterium sp. 4R-513]|uniref:3-hydroxyacyl-CoA dehydrogenase family protein n=1 Tax=Microbacterium sp. 4R-513 TaxID=2567934 RepID=UPI0013E1AAF5|nr:3-hydroxyacyl-CoA dehydrogenase family protein [Microbacterium sp. 4R-513]QIG39507.1 3-hydroxyacyl-CoA dehydrogenase family protein [Microbacterium sp. 4R-513]
MIAKTAVVGSGYMGGGIAQVLALAGRDVVLADVSAELASGNRERIIGEARAHAARGIFPPDAAERIADRVAAAPSIEDAVADVDFVEEAVPEVVEIKHQTLARISDACRPDALIGSNTSTISIGTLAEAVGGPERFLGVHFSNPAPFIPGVEVIPHAGTRPDAATRVVELLRECGKVGVPIADVTGFVLNRLQYALFGEAARLVEEGVATPEAIDLIARTTFGFRLPFFGPFAIADIAGLDVYEFCYQSLHGAYPDRFSAPGILTEHVERGEKGMKTGGGFLATPPERAGELAAYRDEAYAELTSLLQRLGEAPVDY